MSSSDWVILGVVLVAFIAGYAIISFIAQRIKVAKQASRPTSNDSHQKAAGSQTETGKTEQSGTGGEGRYQDQQRQGTYEQTKGQGQTWNAQSETRKHADVLGLGESGTAADVKRAYRELLAKYHPDKVSHLGVEFQHIAEKKTREIIVAYEFFRTKYGF